MAERHTGFRKEEPTIIGTEQLNDTFGATGYCAVSEEAPFSSQGMAIRLGECGLTQTGNLDPVAIPKLSEDLRGNPKFIKWVAEDNI